MNSVTLQKSLILLIGIIAYVCGQCPSSNSALTKFSSVSGWNQAGAQVNISAGQSVILDISPAQLNSINIFGTLYFTDASDLSLTVNDISVYAGGALIIGTPSCPITHKVIVTFYGPRSNHSQSDMGFDSFDNTSMGSKGLSVRTNGTLIVNGWYEGPSWTNLAQIAKVGSNTLVLREAVSWQAGDQIIVTSTDYSETIANLPSTTSAQWQAGNGDPDQTEQVTIQSVNGNVVTLTAPLNFTHWAGNYQYAEVGLLTRRIVFQGDSKYSDAYEFGGQILMRKGIQLQLVGAEFYRMGQKGLLGRYPIHFHWIHNASGLEYLVEQCSIHWTYFRSLTIHETYGVTIRDVVAYKTYGHMYFLEQGGEHNNTFDHCLGAVAYPIPNEEFNYGIPMQVIPTDTDPSIYWILNPDNTFTNNAAVGSEFGFWLTFPQYPIGDSYAYWQSVNPNYQPDTLTLTNFYNNTVHSCGSHCLFIGEGPTQDGVSLFNNNPYWGTDADVLIKTTAYKCRGSGLWSQTNVQFSESVVADTQSSMFFNGHAAAHDSIFIGISGNVGIVPIGRQNYGVSTYDVGNPQHSYNNIFMNFSLNWSDQWGNNYKAGAQLGEGSGLYPYSRTYNNTYINAVPYTNAEIDQGKGAFVWNDIDGSSTGVVGGAYIISENQLITLPADKTNCVFNTTIPLSWVCPIDGYGHVQAWFTDPTTIHSYQSYPATLLNGTIMPPVPQVERYKLFDLADHTRTGNGHDAGDLQPCQSGNWNSVCEALLFNMPPKRMIEIQFTYFNDYRASPNAFRVEFGTAQPGDWLYVALPYPTSAVFTLTDGNGNTMTQVSSIAAVNTSTYWYDSTNELLWVFVKASAAANEQIAQAVHWNQAASWNIVNIVAQCPNNLCQPTLSKLQTLSTAPALPITQNIYYGSLSNSAVVPGTAATSGAGFAQFFHYPAWNEVHVAVGHDLTAYDATISIGVGASTSAGFVLSWYLVGTSVSHNAFQATPVLMESLYTGNLYVQVNSSQYPNGHLRTQLYCSGTCTKPVILKETNVCQPGSGTYYVFNNGAFVNGWQGGVYNKFGQESWGIVPSGLCGPNSIRGTFLYGELQISGSVAITSAYNYLQFYIKAAPGTGVYNPIFWLRTPNGDSQHIRLQPYALDGQLDDVSGWQLVSIPLSTFQFGSSFTVTTIIWNYWGTITNTDVPITVYIDQIRFTANPPATYDYGATLVAAVAPGPTTPTTAPGANYPVYIGCYVDSNTRDLPTQITSISSSSMSVESCEKACLAANFAYAGVQYGGECRCGNTYGAYGKAPASDCSMPCNGASSEICGSAWRNSIYQVADASSKVTADNIRNSAIRTRGANCLFVLMLVIVLSIVL